MSVVFTENSTFSYVPKSLTYIMAHPNQTSRHMLLHGIFEKDLIRWCEELFHTDKTFLDIGSHIGTYSMHLAKQFGHVHAFEAQKHTYNCLCGSIALNNFSNKITPHHVALTKPEDVGILTLNIVSQDGGGSTVKKAEKILRREQVEAKTLDSFNIENIGFIKIDVEGAELDVLKGSTETLEKSDYPPILFEVNLKDKNVKLDMLGEGMIEKEEIFKYLNNMGYNIFRKSQNMFLAIHPN